MKAVGSSYLMRQSPGAERYGGLTVILKPRGSDEPKFEIECTDWRTDEPIKADLTVLVDAARQGISEAANDMGARLDDYDIVLCRFAYHDVDSKTLTFKTSAYSAFASALATWHGRPVTRK